MMAILCKNKDNIYWLLWGNPGDTIDSYSRFTNPESQDSKYFDQTKLVDMRQFNCRYYEGFPYNRHHITTSSYYRIIIPYLSLLLGFNFDINDFDKITYITKEYPKPSYLISCGGVRFDCSYLWPKNNYKFTLDIGGERICEHENFECLTNATDKWDKKYGAHGTEYHKLFRGSHESSRIINETIENNKSICISGDSFFIPIVPILACYFKEVVYLDLRPDRENKYSSKQYYEDKIFDFVIISCWEGNSIFKYLKLNLE